MSESRHYGQLVHAMSQLLVGVDTDAFNNGAPEPLKSIGLRVRECPIESRSEKLISELDRASEFDREQFLIEVSRCDPSQPYVYPGSTETDPTTLPVPAPFPANALPESLRDLVVDGARAIGCPPEYIALPLLTCAGAAIGTSACIEVKNGWVEFPLLYTAVVGPSGSKKTPAKKLATRFTMEKGIEYSLSHKRDLENWARECAEYDIARTEGRQKSIDESDPIGERPRRPIERRMSLSDATVEAISVKLHENPRGFVLIRDELSALPFSMNQYKSGQGSDQQFFLSVWSSDPIQIDRKKEGDTISVPQPFMAITGGIQPAVLQRALGGSRLDDGFTARFLMAYPETPPLTVNDEIVEEVTIARVQLLFDRLCMLCHSQPYATPPKPQVVRMSPPARREYCAWEQRVNVEINAMSEDDPLRTTLSKMPGQLARIAVILQTVKWVGGECERFEELEHSTMSDAIKLTDYFIAHARRVWARLVESPEDAKMRSVRNWMSKRSTPASIRDLLRNGVGGLKSSAEAVSVMQRMCDCGSVRPVKFGKSERFELVTGNQP